MDYDDLARWEALATNGSVQDAARAALAVPTLVDEIRSLRARLADAEKERDAARIEDRAAARSRRDLRDAVEAWTSDEASQREDEGRED